jgi:SAM-dependent methyltransferase
MKRPESCFLVLILVRTGEIVKTNEVVELNLEHFDECYSTKGDRRVAIGTSVQNQRFQLFLKLIPKRSLILDQGCGTGYVAQFLLDEGHKVDCLDISPVAIKKCKQFFTLAGFNSEKYNLWVQDFLTFEYPETKYDGIMDLFTLHFVPHENQKRILESIFRALKPGGYFFLGVMLIGSIKIKEPYSRITENGGTLLKVDEIEAYRCFYLWNPYEIRSVLTNLGFKIIHSYHPLSSIEFICQK